MALALRLVCDGFVCFVCLLMLLDVLMLLN
jgi:hypothetical protein